MTMQMEDRLLMERLDRLEAKLKEDMRELEFLKNMQVIRQWRRRNKQ
jgi:DNA/RNA-binding domain of Phe-tRNA-synthetase-like protein